MGEHVRFNEGFVPRHGLNCKSSRKHFSSSQVWPVSSIRVDERKSRLFTLYLPICDRSFETSTNIIFKDWYEKKSVVVVFVPGRWSGRTKTCVDEISRAGWLIFILLHVLIRRLATFKTHSPSLRPATSWPMEEWLVKTGGETSFEKISPLSTNKLRFPAP